MEESTVTVASPPSVPSAPPIILRSTAKHAWGAGRVTAVHAATWVAILLAGGCWTVAEEQGPDVVTNVSWNS